MGHRTTLERLECFVQFWACYFKRHINKLEHFQKREECMKKLGTLHPEETNK